ncbi:MAG: tetratricopeptide repeat protein [Vicinamibacterales bacterium]
MRAAVHGLWRVTLACVLAAAAAGCSRERTATAKPSANAHALQSPSIPALPDVSRFDESVQQRIRSEYETLVNARTTASPRELSEPLGRMGRLLVAAEAHEASRPFFEAARTLSPEDMRWSYYLGHVHLALQKPEMAASFFEEAHRLDPRAVPTRIWLGETYLTLGRAADAERQLAAATELQPASTAAWFWRGRAALAMQDHAQAVRYLERALTLNPSPAVHYQLGLAYRALGDRSRAEQHLKHRGDAASIVPDDPLLDSLRGMFDSGAAYLTRGLEAIDRRDWATAVANLRTASELSPRDAAVHLNLGTALFLSGDRPAARRAFETAVKIAPDLPKPWYTLGLVAESDMRDTEAIAHFTAAVGLDPNYLEAHASLADALRRTGQVDASLPHYLKVLALNPAVSQARFGYALGLVRLGRFREARDSLRDAVAMYPDQPGFAHALARILAAAPDDAVRDGAAAVRLTEKLLESNRSWTLLETRAMAAAEVGRFEDALKWQQAAIDEAGSRGFRLEAEATRQAQMREILDGYRRRIPCRTPWFADDAVFSPRPSG